MKMDENHLQQTTNVLKTCIRDQCDEVEMLQSIFCNPGEMKISDHSILTDMFDYLEGRRNDVDRKLDYAISMPIPNTADKLELQFDLPLMYPAIEKPLLTVRLTLHKPNKLQIENELKHKLYEYIDSDEVDKSSVYIYSIIVWLQENLVQILNNSSMSTKSKHFGDQSAPMPAEPVIEMERLWIYSHHLKSSTKRADILKLAHELNLTGFSKPGKPGIICIEGEKGNTQEFWKCIRQWAWQRITLRVAESKSKSQTKCNQFRRFSKFGETMERSIDDNNELNSAVPVNMSEFMKFLERHNCGYVKRELFQLD